MASTTETPSSLLILSPNINLLPTVSPSSVLSEAYYALSESFKTYLLNSDPPSFSCDRRAEAVVCSIPSVEEGLADGRVQGMGRGELDVTVKVFLPSNNSSTTLSTSDKVSISLKILKELTGVELVDSFLLAWGGVEYLGTGADGRTPCDGAVASLEGNTTISQDKFDQLVLDWKSISALLPSNLALGVSSFSLPLLQKFITTLESSSTTTRLPTIDHLSVSDCCTIPPTMAEYARRRDIALVSSVDRSEPVTTSHLKKLLEPYTKDLPPQVTASPDVEWVLKYTILHKKRGVVVDKGYIVSASL